LHHWAQHCYH